MSEFNKKLILIFGLERSGTTWIGHMFKSHPKCFYVHEPDNKESKNSLRGFPTVARMSHLNNYQEPLFVFINKFLKNDNAKQSYIVWKSVVSVGRIGAIAKIIEGCGGVLVIRHPCGHVASVMDGIKNKKFDCAIPAYEDYCIFEELIKGCKGYLGKLSINKIRQMLPVERLALRWALFYEKAMEEIKDLNNFTLCSYDELCFQPIEGAKRLLNRAGLKWDQNVENYILDSVSQHEDDYYSKRKYPLMSSNRWRQELTEAENKKIADIVQLSAPGKLFKYENK